MFTFIVCLFVVVFFINNNISFIQKYLHTHFGELSACKLPIAWMFNSIHISFYVGKMFFNVIFDVEYYNMTENQYFQLCLFPHAKSKNCT